MAEVHGPAGTRMRPQGRAHVSIGAMRVPWCNDAQ